MTRKGFYYAIKVSGESAENFGMVSYIEANKLSIEVLKEKSKETFDNPNVMLENKEYKERYEI